jgi:hypothetical protein
MSTFSRVCGPLLLAYSTINWRVVSPSQADVDFEITDALSVDDDGDWRNMKLPSQCKLGKDSIIKIEVIKWMDDYKHSSSPTCHDASMEE